MKLLNKISTTLCSMLPLCKIQKKNKEFNELFHCPIIVLADINTLTSEVILKNRQLASPILTHT